MTKEPVLPDGGRRPIVAGTEHVLQEMVAGANDATLAIRAAIAFWPPIASSVTMQPSSRRISSNSGMAAISFDLPSTGVAPVRIPLANSSGADRLRHEPGEGGLARARERLAAEPSAETDEVDRRRR